MTRLLYYSYSTNLTEDEIVEIDKKVFRNRELFYRFITKLSSNRKGKTKRVIVKKASLHFKICLYLHEKKKHPLG